MAVVLLDRQQVFHWCVCLCGGSYHFSEAIIFSSSQLKREIFGRSLTLLYVFVYGHLLVGLKLGRARTATWKGVWSKILNLGRYYVSLWYLL